MIQVLYKTGNTGYVEPLSLNLLIELKTIICFRRKNGITILGRDPVRRKLDSRYSGPERRKQSL